MPAIISLISNPSALTTIRHVGSNAAAVAEHSSKLACGLRIRKASDDASGLAVSSSLSVDSRVYGQAVRNINDALSVTEVAASALEQLELITERGRELAEQSSNGTLSFSQRKALDSEAKALSSEYNRIVSSAAFGAQKIFADANASAVQIAAGDSLSANALYVDFGTGLSRNVFAGSFQAAATVYLGPSGADMILDDLNEDGLCDIVSSSFALLSNGDGSFSAALTYSGVYYNRISAADFDGDGVLDLVGSINSGFTIHHGNGDGTFSQLTSVTGAVSAWGIKADDLNRDGIADVILADSSAGTRVYFGNGDGSMRSSVLIQNATLPFPFYCASTGDYNGDGLRDIAFGGGFAGFPAGETNVAFNLGNGTFSTAVTLPWSWFTGTLASGDFDQDGRDELIADGVRTNSVLYHDYLSATGSFSTTEWTTLTSGVAALDLNGDGYLDIGSRDITLFGNGDGTFSVAVSLGNAAGGGSFGDFNGDDVPDSAARIGNSIVTYLANATKTNAVQILNLTTASAARSALDMLQSQQERISLEKGLVGTFQSRLSSALANLSARRENYESAASRITDADVAEHSAGLVKAKMLEQASASVLAQANQQPALAIQLLKAF